MIKPELEFVYEAGGELEAPREIGPAYRRHAADHPDQGRRLCQGPEDQRAS